MSAQHQEQISTSPEDSFRRTPEGTLHMIQGGLTSHYDTESIPEYWKPAKPVVKTGYAALSDKELEQLF